jgi:Co/Zn/Cd efflux system component
VEHCCQNKAKALEALRHTQRRTLQLVLALNAAMFIIELAAGWWARSASILGDSLDSRNDIIANLAVLAAAWLVQLTGSAWPDLLVGLSLAGLFLSSAARIVQGGRVALRQREVRE